MPMKAAVVAKNELVEIGVDMFAAQTMIRPQRPALQQREGAVAPWEASGERGLPSAIEASNRRGRLFKATARPLPHPGQTNPSGQRRAERNAAQRASSGNSFWSSASVRPRPTAPRSESARPAALSAPSFRHYI